MVVDQTPDPLSQGQFTKIYQQSDRHMQQPQICQNLFCMNRMQFFDRFDLDNKLIFDQQIHARHFAKIDTVKNNVYRPLPINLISHHRQSTGQQRLIDAFQQAWSNLTMESHRNTNQIVGNLIDVRSHCLCDLCVLCAN